MPPERLLDGVLGVGLVRTGPASDLQRADGVAVVELRVRGAVAALDASHELVVAGTSAIGDGFA